MDLHAGCQERARELCALKAALGAFGDLAQHLDDFDAHQNATSRTTLSVPYRNVEEKWKDRARRALRSKMTPDDWRSSVPPVLLCIISLPQTSYVIRNKQGVE